MEAGNVLLDEASALAEQAGDLQALRLAQSALAERDLLAEQPAAAHARLVPLLDHPGQQEALVTYLLPYLAWAALDLGREVEAEERLQECLARATREHIRLAQVDALRVQALLAARQGEFAEAKRALDEGLSISRDLPYPYAGAKLLYAAGLVARAHGNAEQARNKLRQARDALGALGEGLYLPLVEQALGSLG